MAVKGPEGRFAQESPGSTGPQSRPERFTRERVREQSTCELPNCLICRRLRHAAVEVAALNGIHAATAAAIGAYAGVSDKSMAEHYASGDRCLVAAYDEAAEFLERACAAALGEPAVAATGSRGERLGAAVSVGMQALVAWPRVARFCLVEADRTDVPELREHRVEARERFVAMLADRIGVAAGDRPAALQLELLAGAAYQLVGTQLARGDGDFAPLHSRLERLLEAFEPARAA